MACMVGLGGALVGLFFALPLFLLVFPAAFGAILGGVTDSALPLGGGLAIAALCFVGYLPFLIVLGGILRAYIQSAWTLTYMQLTKDRSEIEAAVETIPAE